MKCTLSPRIRLAFFAAASLFATSVTHAQNLFNVDATTTSGAPLSVSLSSENLLDLVEDAIEASDSFAVFNGRDTRVAVDYANLSEAIIVNVNAAATSATLDIPGIGFSRVFTGSSRDNLQEQIEDFIQDSGADVYADFLEVVSQQTLVSVLDGNPASATAILARTAIDRHTLSRVGSSRNNDADGSWFRAAASISGSSVDRFSATRAELDVAGGFLVAELVGLSFATVISTQDIEGTEYVNGGFEFGVPITPLGPSGAGSDFSLVITPLAQIGYGLSLDAGEGGLFYGLGVNATGIISFDPFELVLGVQFLAFDGIDVEFEDDDDSDFQFDSPVQQQIVSIGVAIRTDLFDAVAIEAGVSYNHFLEDVAVDGFISPDVKVALGKPGALQVKIGYRGDFADDFSSNGGSLEVYVPF